MNYASYYVAQTRTHTHKHTYISTQIANLPVTAMWKLDAVNFVLGEKKKGRHVNKQQLAKRVCKIHDFIVCYQ